MKVDILVEDREVLDYLRRLNAVMDDMTPAMRAISLVLANVAEQSFEREASPAGAEWKDLEDSTKAARAKKGTWPGSILQVSTAGLASSIQAEHGRDYAAAGTNKIYAAIHQFGGDAGRGHKVHIPARPYLGLSDDGKAEILDILSDFIAISTR